MQEDRYLDIYKILDEFAKDFKYEMIKLSKEGNKKEHNNLDKLFLLKEELFFRVIRRNFKNEDLREDVINNLDNKISEQTKNINSFVDYKEDKISRKEFLDTVLDSNKNAMQAIKSEMKSKVPGRNTHQDKNAMQEIKDEMKSKAPGAKENDLESKTNVRRNR